MTCDAVIIFLSIWQPVHFIVVFVLGIFVARYIKDYYWWFPLHIILQATGVLLSIVGFGLAVAMTEGSHFSTLHSWFGLVTLCLSVVAPALGVAADMTYEPTRDSPPWWPDIFHCKDPALWCRTIGICVLLLLLLFCSYC